MKRKYIVLLMGLLFLLAFTGCSNKKNPLHVFDGFVKSWEKQDYTAMYEEISFVDRGELSQKNFQKNYEDFYKDLGISSIAVENLADETKLKDDIKEGKEIVIPIKVELKTKYGNKTYNIDVSMVKEEEDGKASWKIDWDYPMVYKDFAAGDTIKTSKIPTVRGEIFDRNGEKLAQNGTVIQVGIVPGRLGNMKEEIISDLSKTYGVTEEYINKRLSLTWVTDDTFVDLIKIPVEKQSTIEKLNSKNKGATYKEVKDRVYPFKEITAHLTGYLGFVSEDELKELEPLGFTANDKVGRTGLEKIFDESLRGTPGQSVSMVDEGGNVKEVLFQKEEKDGEDLKLTIDIEMQSKLYEQMKSEQGTATSLNHKTGEIMALVSTPSYDPNAFVLGIGESELQKLQDSPDNPLLNRFTKVYAPGSTLKPITEAIALHENKVDEDFTINVKGLDWQKDSSWGNYFITRVKDPGTPVNLEKAMIYSDNIYFGQVALKIGAETFVEKAKDFGIGVDLKIRYGLDRSQLASNDKISKEVLLADTGYGQGEVLINIVNLPKAYSAFVNKGNVVEPKLIADDAAPKMTNAISEEVAGKILSLMTKVVADPKGTGHEAYIPGKTIAGKTGTAEINNPTDASKKEELGWFAAIDTSDKTPYITAMMVENVKGRGGSHVAIPKVKKFIESY